MPEVPQIIGRRAVLYFGGYEKADAERQYMRLVRELKRFEGTWNVRSTAGAPQEDIAHGALTWDIDTEASNWRVRTRFHYCAWNDLIAEDFARPDWKAIPAGIAALFDFVLTGTAFRYFAVAWRYGLFFSYAIVLVAAVALAAMLAVALADGALSALGAAMPWYAELPLGVAAFWALLRWPGDLFHARYMLNDWNFASAIAWGRRTDYRRRLDMFSRLIGEVARRGDADEVLIVGHSLGAVLAAESLAGAIRDDPGLAAASPPVTVMTVGSSLLKVGLHPGATGLRRSIETVLNTPQVAWIDYTALVDVLNFYHCDPVRVLRLDAPRSPVIRTAKIRAMLSPRSYRRFRYNLLRLHRQFVMGNEVRYHYDFFMSCCGPMPMRRRIENLTLSVDNFAEDGTYLPSAQAADSASDAERTAPGREGKQTG
ncbi:hypothetical protein [Microbaculum marinum]|uniref:Alpha/beta hydrolase n=1 Tax=Microbaculum marinum TaxID=1764581 RepID=A0AAW9RUC6_9HYPH